MWKIKISILLSQFLDYLIIIKKLIFKIILAIAAINLIYNHTLKKINCNTLYNTLEEIREYFLDLNIKMDYYRYLLINKRPMFKTK